MFIEHVLHLCSVYDNRPDLTHAKGIEELPGWASRATYQMGVRDFVEAGVNHAFNF
jgi:hypothetical protein